MTTTTLEQARETAIRNLVSTASTVTLSIADDLSTAIQQGTQDGVIGGLVHAERKIQELSELYHAVLTLHRTKQRY